MAQRPRASPAVPTCEDRRRQISRRRRRSGQPLLVATVRRTRSSPLWRGAVHLGSAEHLALRQSKVGSKFTLEWRHAAHIHRHFSSKGAVLSYINSAATAVSGALLYLVGVADLTGLGLLGAAQRRVQIAHNLAFIQEERRQLRERLRAAANDDAINVFAGAQLQEFVAPGATAATAVDLERLDLDD